jgi:hypothetical protein
MTGSTNCDELKQNAAGSGRSRLPQSHKNHGAEKHAKGLETGIYLAECHAQQGGRKGGRSDQQRHGAFPVFDLALKNAI